MYIQYCVKGITGFVPHNGGISQADAQACSNGRHGISSNWWRKYGTISPDMIEDVLTDANLDRHLHDYDNYGERDAFHFTV